MRAKLIFIATSAFIFNSYSDKIQCLGAKNFLKQVSIQDEEEKSKSPVQEWLAVYEEIKNKNKQNNNAEVSLNWLTLYDSYLELNYDDYMELYDYFKKEKKGHLLDLFPEPNKWDELTTLIEKREGNTNKDKVRELHLKLLMSVLNNDVVKQEEIVTELSNQINNLDDSDKRHQNSLLASLIPLLSLEVEGSKPPEIVQLEEDLNQASQHDSPQYINMPDLVTLVGRKEAEKILVKTFKTKNINLSFRFVDGSDTYSLAQKIALKMIAELNKAHWELCFDIPNIELFEAFEKKFVNKPKENKEKLELKSGKVLELTTDKNNYHHRDYELNEALRFYLYSLLLDNKLEKAYDVLSKLISNRGYLSLYGSIGEEFINQKKEVLLYDFFKSSLDLNRTILFPKGRDTRV